MRPQQKTQPETVSKDSRNKNSEKLIIRNSVDFNGSSQKEAKGKFPKIISAWTLHVSYSKNLSCETQLSNFT